MKQSRFAQWAFFAALLFVGTACAASHNETPHQALEIVSEDHQLPIVSQPPVLKRMPLSLGDTHGSVVKLTAPDRYVEPYTVRQPDTGLNFLGMDELWVTYRAASGSRNCILSGNIRALGSPLSAGQSELLPDVSLNVSSGGKKIYGDPIILDGKVLPRDVNYLIRREIGMYDNTGWRMVDKGKLVVFMHLMRVDIHKISSIEFEMDSAVERVNFRLSREASGKPTDILEWQDIPKDIVEYGAKRRVRLDFASVIQQNLPGTLQGSLPLNLVEMIVFIDKDAIANGVAPINRLDSYYDTPGSAVQSSSIRALSYSERIGSNLWRWRMSLSSLYKLQLDKVVFTDGQIIVDNPACIAAFEDAALVSLPPQVMLMAKPDTKNSIPALRDAPLPTVATANLYLRWLTLAVFVVFAAWVLIPWRQGTVQRNVLALWNDLVKLNGRSSRSWNVLGKVNGNFFVAMRQGLNLLLLLVVLTYGLLGSGKYPFINSSIEERQIGLLIFSAFAALHAWRWHVQFSMRKRVDVIARWIVGQGKWPPLVVWALTGAILIIMVIVHYLAHITSAEGQKFVANLAASDASGALEMLILRGSLALTEQGLNLPVSVAFGYGFLPWLSSWGYRCLFFGARFMRGDLVALLLYGFGLKHIGQPGENYFFTLGALALVFALRTWLLAIEPRFRGLFPAAAERIYAEAGSLYFFGALVMLVATATLLSVKLQPIAEQLVIVAYYCLVIGTVQAAWALRKGDKKTVDIPNKE